jgi:hypothetical protein
VLVTGEFPGTRLVVLGADGRTELMNDRIWDYTDPLDFNVEQERDSYLLTLSAGPLPDR